MTEKTEADLLDTLNDIADSLATLAGLTSLMLGIDDSEPGDEDHPINTFDHLTDGAE